MATRSEGVGVVETRTVRLPGTLPLDCGRTLRDVEIAYETYGELTAARDNVVLISHALTGDAHAAGLSVDPDAPSAGELETHALGWWDAMIGPGRAFDTDRWFVVCTNLLGGCRGSTGPASLDPETGRPYGSAFPPLTIADLVRAQKAFLDELGIDSLLAAAGASMGGMQALQFAIDHPDVVRGVVAIASTAHLDTRGIALNAIARNAITTDPDWQGGDFYGTGRPPKTGLAVARQVGHITYLSRQSMHEKFGRTLAGEADRPTLVEPWFAVESYLRYQGAKFVGRFDANTYLLFSRALTWFDLPLERLREARARFLLLSFSSDWIYPPSASEELESALRAAGREVEHTMLDVPYGHDSFLLEDALQAPYVRRFLEETYAA
jgi:homoserine O-acetyltransferase/O-succinyltransferase